jgi:hypothetical protein
MPESIIESLLAFLVMVFRYEVGTVEFYIAVGCTLVGILVVARLLAGLFGSSKGIFVAAFAMLSPLFLGAMGYVSVELYVLPQIEAGWAASYLPWSVFGVLVLLVTVILSSKLWGIGKGSAVVALIFAGVAGMAAQYGAQLVIDVIDSGSSQVEKRDERMNLEIENAN